jgi:hypothetical protein
MCAEQQRPQDINRLGSPPAEAIQELTPVPAWCFDTLTVSWSPPIRLPDHEQALVGPERPVSLDAHRCASRLLAVVPFAQISADLVDQPSRLLLGSDYRSEVDAA